MKSTTLGIEESVSAHIDSYLRISASQRGGGIAEPDLLCAQEVMAEAKRIYPEGNPGVIAYVASELEKSGEQVGTIVVSVLKKLAAL